MTHPQKWKRITVFRRNIERGLLSGNLRKHEREIDPVTFGDEPLKKRKQQFGGPGDS